jgi:hypothetical protein
MKLRLLFALIATIALFIFIFSVSEAEVLHSDTFDMLPSEKPGRVVKDPIMSKMNNATEKYIFISHMFISLEQSSGGHRGDSCTLWLGNSLMNLRKRSKIYYEISYIYLRDCILVETGTLLLISPRIIDLATTNIPVLY